MPVDAVCDPAAPAASPPTHPRRLPLAHTRSLQGSKDSSSDTPSDHASASASSATSLALEPDAEAASDSGAGASVETSPSKGGLLACPGSAATSELRSSPTPPRAPSLTPTGSSSGLEERRMQRSASQRSNAGPSASQRMRMASRRTSLNYVSGAPPLSRSSSIHVEARGDSASDAQGWSRVRTGLTRTPSTSSAASTSGRPTGRSSSLRYSRSGTGTGAALGGLGLGVGTDDLSNPGPSLAGPASRRASMLGRPAAAASAARTMPDSLLNPVRQPAFEGDTLVSRSHDLLSEIAARERTLLDLKEEVKKQELELEQLRQRWQQSITSTLAHDTPAGTAPTSSAPHHPSSPNPGEPARQAADTLRGWGGKLGSLFDSTGHTGTTEQSSAPTTPSKPASSSTSATSGLSPNEADSARTARHAKRSSIFGLMFAPPIGGGAGAGEEPAARPSHSASESAPTKSPEPPADASSSTSSGTGAGAGAAGTGGSGWWARTWKPRAEPVASKPSPAPHAHTNSHTPSRGPRIENGIVVDDVAEGQPMRIFLEELVEEDEAADRDDMSPTPLKRDLPPLPPR